MVETVKFVCNSCALARFPCIQCKQSRSVFDLGYSDGKLGNPKETTGFNMKDTGLYHAGYIKGRRDRD